MAGRGQRWVNGIWYGASPWSTALLPLSWLFRGVVALRRWLYRAGLKQTSRAGLPVVVIGNLTVGGTGKTPLTLWLVEALAERGIRAGVASRGYGGDPGPEPRLVARDSDPGIVGDEPLLIARRCGCPVVVHPDRVAAARALAAEGVELVVADDALQHYRLARDLEIAVVDGRRGFGNGRLLPAGPLREPVSRLDATDFVLINGDGDRAPDGCRDVAATCFDFSLQPDALRRVATGDALPPESWRGREVHAFAAIGHPERFFATLRALGMNVIEHPLDDHATIADADLPVADGFPIIMTEKDAVKFRPRGEVDAWYLAVSALPEPIAADEILGAVAALARNQDTRSQ